MANGTVVVDRSHETEIADVAARPLPVTGGAGFDWLMAAFGSWLIGGLYLDGWAHIHVPALETFFTPWHAVLYSGYIAGAVALAETLRRNRARGASRWDALPVGYGLSLAGAFLFFFGGLADMLWHIVFGIEEGVEGLISPSHLVLALGGSLMITGPLRAGLAHPAGAARPWLARMPMVVSLTIFLSLAHLLHRVCEPVRDDVGGHDAEDRQRRLPLGGLLGLRDPARVADGARPVRLAAAGLPRRRLHGVDVGERRPHGDHPRQVPRHGPVPAHRGRRPDRADRRRPARLAPAVAPAASSPSASWRSRSRPCSTSSTSWRP